MGQKMNWDKVRRRRAGSKQDLPVLGDPDTPAEAADDEEEFVPRNQRGAERDEDGRLRSASDWRDEVRHLKGDPQHPDTGAERAEHSSDE